MNFVKTSVLKQEFTQQGIKETETEARTKEEIESDERLSKLPEFNRDPQFRSLAEQLYDDQATDSSDKPKNDTQEPKYALASVTEEEFEFYESLDTKEKGLALKRQKEDEDIKKEFAKARETLSKSQENKVHTQFNSNKRSAVSPNWNNNGSANIDLFSSTKTETTAKEFATFKRSPIIAKRQKLETFVTLSPSSAITEKEEKSSAELSNLVNYYSDSEEDLIVY